MNKLINFEAFFSFYHIIVFISKSPVLKLLIRKSHKQTLTYHFVKIILKYLKSHFKYNP